MSEREYYTVVPACYVILRKDNDIFLMRRKNTGYHDGKYNLPAGHVERGEGTIAAAARETQEEAGVDILKEDLAFVHVIHRQCGDHERMDIFFEAKKWKGEPHNAEPEKCDDAQWFSLDDLPGEIVPNQQAGLENYLSGISYSEFEELEDTIF